jgi:hypothetical protein
VSERCIVRVRYTPSGTGAAVRRTVNGFVKYIQHRDLHPEVGGLLKYVAHRDQASLRAELFGPLGVVGAQGRKKFAEFVVRSIERSRPQVFRSRKGGFMDRRRAVYRLVISPERAQGLDLEKLTRVAVTRLEAEMGITNLQWIAAIHRNTRHHHVHLVVAGMHGDGQGGYRRLDLTKPRLAALKEAVGLEIERERGPLHRVPAEVTSVISGSLLRLRAVARRYQRQMQRDAELEVRRLGWERAA